MYIQALLWDLDGVIVDSGELHYESWRQVCPDYQLPFSRELFKQIFGMNNESCVSTLLGRPAPDGFWQEVSRRKEEIFRQLLHGNVTILPGVKHWLELGSEKGLRQAVASSAPKENIEVTLTEGQISNYFSAIISAYEKPGKPDPWVFLEAAKSLQVDPVQCVVIEDSLMGIEAARRAGAKCLAVETTNSRDVLLKSTADWVFDRLPISFPWLS